MGTVPPARNKKNMNLMTALPAGDAGQPPSDTDTPRAMHFLPLPWRSHAASLRRQASPATAALLALGLWTTQSWTDVSAGSALALMAAGVLLTALHENRQARRLHELQLLQALHQAAALRLGKAHIRSQILEQTRDFFSASCCALELSDSEGRRCLHGLYAGAAEVQTLALSPGQTAAQRLPSGPYLAAALRSGPASEAETGRLYLLSPRARRGRDARFLRELAAVAGLLLERADSEEAVHTQARRRERQHLALDLHDSVIQPYIGLRLAIDALRMQAAAGLAIAPGLERVSAMCNSAIADLRRCTRELEQPQAHAEPLLAQIEQQARQLRQFHGVNISVHANTQAQLAEHLRTEILHMVREGLSNICRHTQARSGQVHLDCDGPWLRICIANEGLPQTGSFTPRSISQRAAALGGRALVRAEASGQTAVHIQLPL
jgi:signal transduction histidine kinase